MSRHSPAGCCASGPERCRGRTGAAGSARPRHAPPARYARPKATAPRAVGSPRPAGRAGLARSVPHHATSRRLHHRPGTTPPPLAPQRRWPPPPLAPHRRWHPHPLHPNAAGSRWHPHRAASSTPRRGTPPPLAPSWHPTVANTQVPPPPAPRACFNAPGRPCVGRRPGRAATQPDAPKHRFLLRTSRRRRSGAAYRAPRDAWVSDTTNHCWSRSIARRAEARARDLAYGLERAAVRGIHRTRDRLLRTFAPRLARAASNTCGVSVATAHCRRKRGKSSKEHDHVAKTLHWASRLLCVPATRLQVRPRSGLARPHTGPRARGHRRPLTRKRLQPAREGVRWARELCCRPEVRAVLTPSAGDCRNHAAALAVCGATHAGHRQRRQRIEVVEAEVRARGAGRDRGGRRPTQPAT